MHRGSIVVSRDQLVNIARSDRHPVLWYETVTVARGESNLVAVRFSYSVSHHWSRPVIEITNIPGESKWVVKWWYLFGMSNSSFFEIDDARLTQETILPVMARSMITRLQADLRASVWVIDSFL